MHRILRVAGATVVAALALSGVAAGAQAAEFTASEYPAAFHGELSAGGEVLETEAGAVECDTTVSGEFTEATTTKTMAVVKSNCQAFGFLSATVDTEECHYTLHIVANLGGGKYTATATYECPEGQSIKIVAASCEAEIGSQGPVPHVILTRTPGAGAGRYHMQKEMEGIAYNVNKDGFLCPFGGTGAREDGSLTSVEPMEIISEQALDID